MIKEESKTNNVTLRINYFFKLFTKKKKIYDRSFFFYDLKTRKRNIEIDENLHKKVVRTYFDIYFNEFYIQKLPKYFMLSGLLVKAKGKVNFRVLEDKIQRGCGLLWVWYDRPSEPYFSNVRFTKLTGSKNPPGKLDKYYKEENDIELLKPIKATLENIRQQYKFFKR